MTVTTIARMYDIMKLSHFSIAPSLPFLISFAICPVDFSAMVVHSSSMYSDLNTITISAVVNKHCRNISISQPKYRHFLASSLFGYFQTQQNIPSRVSLHTNPSRLIITWLPSEIWWSKMAHWIAWIIASITTITWSGMHQQQAWFELIYIQTDFLFSIYYR